MQTDIAEIMGNEEESTGGVEKAFRDAEEIEFRGRTLEPFSFVRQTAAVRLGLKYGSLADEEIKTRTNPDYKTRLKGEEELEGIEKRLARKNPPSGPLKAGLEERAETLRKQIREAADEPEELSIYDGLVMDAAIVLWLCCQPESRCRKARRKPEAFESEIDKWADAQGIVMGSDTLAEATAAFGAIMAAVNQSKGTPKLEDAGPADIDPN